MLNDWLSNWNMFVENVINDHKGGLSASQLSEKYGGHSVSWIGQVVKLDLDAEYTPGIQMDMPYVEVEVEPGKWLKTAYLYLRVKPNHLDEWRSCNVGSFIKFNAVLSKGNEIFPGINLSVFDNEDECLLEIGIDDSLPIK